MQAFLDYEGLAIYWGFADLLFYNSEGIIETDATIDGEQWHIRFNYEDSCIAPGPSDDISRETVYEFRLHGDGYGQRKIDVNWAPRWDGLETPDGDQISTP
jgi:hypothetical protein